MSNFGDVRRTIVEVLQDIRDGKLSTEQAKAFAQNVSVLNTNIQTEINYVKVSLLAKEKGHDFGRIARMGKTIIDGSEN